VSRHAAASASRTISTFAARKQMFVFPCRPQGAFHRFENSCIGSDKFLLFLPRQLHHRRVFIGISERRENFPTDTKIGMAHVRRLDYCGKTQRRLAKIILCHRPSMFFKLYQQIRTSVERLRLL
jgi:hypothetical protein